MLSTKCRLVLACAMVIALMLAVPGGTVAAAGAGPDDAQAPNGAWTEILSGQEHWYAFNYDGGEGQIYVRLDAEPKDGVTFSVRTPEQVRIWQETGDMEACGCSSENEAEQIDAFWTGNFKSQGKYYVVVKHSGTRSTPASYALTVDGEGVWYEAPAKPLPVVAPAPKAKERAAEMVMAPDQWMPMEVGSEHWFRFRYEGDGSQIEINLDADPDSGATFSVWTPEQARLFALGEDIGPVGRGSEDANAPGDLTWSGSFPGSGTYFVRVEHSGAAPSNCKLTISGADVWY